MFGLGLFKRKSQSRKPINGAPKSAPVVPLPIFGYIYIAICRTNHRGYIGQTTKDPRERWQQHRQDATARKQTNGLTKRFHFALHEHGANMFDFAVIDTATSREELNRKERYWVAHYKYDDPAYGYNSTSGGASKRERARSSHEVGSPEDTMSLASDWGSRKASDPQKKVLRRLYGRSQPPYCVCANSLSEGGVCRSCNGRTGLTARHAGILIAEFLVKQQSSIPIPPETPEEAVARKRVFEAMARIPRS